MAQPEKSCAMDLRVAGSSPARVLILFPQCLSSSYKNSVLTFKSSSQLPHQSLPAQTAALLTPAFAPPPSPVETSLMEQTFEYSLYGTENDLFVNSVLDFIIIKH